MEDASPAAAAAAGGGGGGGGDWHSQINPEARPVMVANIFKTMRRHLPISDEERRTRLRNIAVGFERGFYTRATTENSYLRKIAMLLIYVQNMNQNPHRQDDKGKSPMLQSPGDDTIPQELWDSALSAMGNEDLTNESTDDGATNLKKRKFDCSSSWEPLLGHPTFCFDVDDDQLSSLAIPEVSLNLPAWVDKMEYLEFVEDMDD